MKWEIRGTKKSP